MGRRRCLEFLCCSSGLDFTLFRLHSCASFSPLIFAQPPPNIQIASTADSPSRLFYTQQ